MNVVSIMGDYKVGQAIRLPFNTATAAEVPTILVNGAVSVYKDGNLTQVTAGVTLGIDHDTVTGLNMVTIDPTYDATAIACFTAGSEFAIVLTVGTVNSVSQVGRILGTFSIANREFATDRITAASISADAAVAVYRW